MRRDRMLAGGIDLGGTKIDAHLFDPSAGWARLDNRDVPTPVDSYPDLLQTLFDQARWLTSRGAGPIGLGAPGLITTEGVALAANLPTANRSLAADLANALGRPVHVLKDCHAFALSETRLGAGQTAACAVGFIIGTGLAAGVVTGGRLLDGPNGQAGEIGHVAIPHHLIERHGLHVPVCGCGRKGCYETLCAGPGIPRIAQAVVGRHVDARDLSDDRNAAVLDVWTDLTAELLSVICLSYDPDVIVLGGGVSRLFGVIGRLGNALAPRLLTGTRPPALRIAEGGDRSGARGAALFAWETEGNAT